MSDLGQPVRLKYIPSLAFVATRARSPADSLREFGAVLQQQLCVWAISKLTKCVLK